MKEDGILSQEAIDMLEDDINLKELLLTPDAVSKLALRLEPITIALLKSGNIKTALSVIASRADIRTAKLATKLEDAIPDGIKIEIVDGLKDASGKDAAGIYDYTTDTIKLDSKTGLNTHVLMHELVHSATSLIANKANPDTKKLQALFDDVKDSLDTAYGK